MGSNMSVAEVLRRAKLAARTLARRSGPDRNAALEAIAESIDARRQDILRANAEDMASAASLTSALQDRLRLNDARMDGIIRALCEVQGQPDPLSGSRAIGQGRSGIEVSRRRVPLGVIAIIYEARPNVTAECAALTIKSGNAVVLRGGKEAKNSNRALGQAVRAGLQATNLPVDAVQLMVESTREDVRSLLGATGQVDLVIPRGGHGLMTMVDELARVPVIRHGQGICHVYVDDSADLEMAAAVAFNSKVHRPGVCNAMETLLVHESQVDGLLRTLGPKLSEAGVALRADPAAGRALDAAQVPWTASAPEDWHTEFLDLVLAIRTVPDLEAALDHIDAHGTHHTASIVTEHPDRAETFLQAVDASCVLWNASTRFNDGGELGLGAEMGISTSKMHAYGPMSVSELTAEKLVVLGQGQVR